MAWQSARHRGVKRSRAASPDTPTTTTTPTPTLSASSSTSTSTTLPSASQADAPSKPTTRKPGSTRRARRGSRLVDLPVRKRARRPTKVPLLASIRKSNSLAVFCGRNVPHYALRHLLRFLPWRTLGRVSCCSLLLYHECREPTLWQTLDLNTRPTLHTADALKHLLAARCSTLTVLRLGAMAIGVRTLTLIARTCPALHELDLCAAKAGPKFLDALDALAQLYTNAGKVAKAKKKKTGASTGAGGGAGGGAGAGAVSRASTAPAHAAVPKGLAVLTKLVMRQDLRPGGSRTNPKFASLPPTLLLLDMGRWPSIPAGCLISLAECTPRLQHLDFGGDPKFPYLANGARRNAPAAHARWQRTLQQCPQLSHLVLASHEYGDELVELLAHACPELRSLTLRHSPVR